MRVFLSYRRSDAAAYAGRLSDALIQRLGPKSVFQDVSSVTPGRDFRVEIDRALSASDAAVVVIGPGWVSAETPQGTRRLLETDDYVRLEVSRALSRDIRVIPVLVGGAQLPAGAALPADLQELTRRQAVELHDETWHRDVDGLVRSLRGEAAVPVNRRRRWMAAGTAAVVLAALGAGGWFLWGPGTGTQVSGGSTSKPPCETAESPEWHPIALNQSQRLSEVYPRDPSTITVTEARWRAIDGEWRVILGTTLSNGSKDFLNPGYWRYGNLEVADQPFQLSCFTPSNDSLGPGLKDVELVGFDTRCKPIGLIRLEVEGGVISVTPDALDPGPC
jgi:hypothetical protein